MSNKILTALVWSMVLGAALVMMAIVAEAIDEALRAVWVIDTWTGLLAFVGLATIVVSAAGVMMLLAVEHLRAQWPRYRYFLLRWIGALY